MSIKTKNAGAYADVVGVFHKRAGTYEAVQGVYAKVGGVYGRVDAATYPVKSFYSTDFAGVANNTNLVTLTGWDAYDGTGLVTPDPVSGNAVIWKIQSEAATVASAADFGTRPGAFIVARDSGALNHVFKATMKTIPASGNHFVMVFAATKMNNCCFIECTNSAGVMQNVVVQKNVAGTVTSLASIAASSTPLGRSPAAGDIFEVRVLGQTAHVYVNGYLISGAGINLDTGGAYTKGQLCGFGTRSAGGVVFDDLYMAAQTANITVTDTQIFWPGSLALSGRDATFAGAYTGTVDALDYRVVNAVTRAPVKDWARVSGPTIGSGAWAATVFVPMADTTINPKLRIEFRAANDTDAAARSNATTVGVTVASYGQSNSALRGNPSATSHAVSGNSYSWSPTSSSVWQGGAATTVETVQKWADQLASVIGIPVGVHVDGRGSRSLANLIATGPGTPWQDLLDRTSLSKSQGFIYSWLWTQGENEAGQSSYLVAADETAYRANFDTLLSMLRGVSAIPDAKVGVVVIGRYTGVHAGGATIGDANWSFMRGVLARLVDKTGVYNASNFIDTPMVDEFHYSGDGYVENGRRSGLSMRKAMGYAPSGYDGRGPIITGATRSGATITLAVNLNGASSISGTGLTNYQVSTDDFATTKTISSAAVSGGNIVITLSADPGAAVKVRSFYGMTYGTPTFAIGTYADATTIPVEPLYVPVTSN